MTTLADVVLTAATWTNLYTATGITLGDALHIWNKGSDNVILAESVASPSGTVGVPMFVGPLSNYLYVDTGSANIWAYSTLGSRLSVQEA